MQRDTFLSRVEGGYTSIIECIERMDDAEMERPRRDDGWSARDIVAHLADWYDVAADRVRMIAQGRGDELQLLDSDEVDAMNARFRQRDQALSTPQVRDRFAAAHASLLGALRDIPDRAWADQTTRAIIERRISPPTFKHDATHLPDLT